MEYCIFDTAWGSFGFVANNGKLVAAMLPRASREIRLAIRQSYADATERPGLMVDLQQEVVRYFEGKPARFRVKVDLSQRPTFHQAALRACKRIPYGQTTSYGELAQAIGAPRAARAVGGAMARNPIPLFIPCHRVLRAGGGLGGFSSPGGSGEKEALLELERRGILNPGRRLQRVGAF